MNDNGTRDDLRALVRDIRAVSSPFRTFLTNLHRRYQGVNEGAVADYIPELAKADPNWFGIAVATVGGDVYEVGDSRQEFTIQSAGKPFAYGLALETYGREAVLSRVGVEPTGDAFNAIVLDQASNRPFNPMVNAGAIATSGMVPGANPTDRLNATLDAFRQYAGRPLQVDASVYTSERTTGHRNRAIAHLMLNFGMVDANVDETLDLYFQQCSILVNARDLALMGATLANGGVHPLSGERAISGQYVKDVLSIMYTCGMYNYAGQWAYSVGIPAKSGVGGGIVAVVPRQLAIAVFSPQLDSRGNSVRGIRVCEELTARLGLHTFDCEADLTVPLDDRVRQEVA